MKPFLLIIVLSLISLSSNAQGTCDGDDGSAYLDSLSKLYYQLPMDDKRKLDICDSLVMTFENTDSISFWAREKMKIGNFHHDNFVIAEAYFNIAWVDYYVDNYDSCIVNANKAYTFLEALETSNANIINLKYQIFGILGACYAILNNYEFSDHFYNKALDVADLIPDRYYIAEAYRHIGENYTYQCFFDGADSLLRLSLHYDSLAVDKSGMSDGFFRLANLYIYQCKRNLSDVDTLKIKMAKEYMNIAFDENQDDFFLYQLFYPRFESYFLEYKYLNRSAYQRKCLLDTMDIIIGEGRQYIEDYSVGDDEMVLLDLARARLMIARKNYTYAKFLLDSISTLHLNYLDIEIKHLISSEYYQAIGKMDSALYFNQKYYESVLANNSVDLAVKSAQNLVQSDFNAQIRKREDEDKQRRQRVRMIFLAVIGILIFLGYEYFRKRRHNRVLSQKNMMLIQQKEEINNQKEEIQAQSDELFEQNEIITKKNMAITDSINYASLIQRAVLPDDEQMKSMFGDYFLIYRPLNIVAGDFYWVSRVGKYKILVCADCTGHGVPGAFVSMLGVSLLNDVVPQVVTYNNGNAADILNELRTRLMKSLGQDKRLYDEGRRSNMDGMDLALIMIEEGTMNLQYAGAYRPLWICRNGELIVQNADKMPIGIYLGKVRNFTNHQIQLMPGDSLYMFSDGIPDQFGFLDEERTVCKHFSTKRFAQLITKVAPLPMDEQKAIIEKEVDDFKNGYKQLDDNILVGIRI